MPVRVFYPPHCPDPTDVPDASIFLAGTIDMGASVDWQQQVIHALNSHPSLSKLHIHVYNPRRLDWNNEWKQSIDSTEFKEQVDWELDALMSCPVLAFNILSESKSPITLMELGLCAGARSDCATCMILRCEPGFWRKGNVDILAQRYAIPQILDMESWMDALVQKLHMVAASHSTTVQP